MIYYYRGDYDKALEFVAGGGYAGAIRVVTQYENDEIFDEDGDVSEVAKNLGGILTAENKVQALEDKMELFVCRLITCLLLLM